jgi:hypothetical protein
MLRNCLLLHTDYILFSHYYPYCTLELVVTCIAPATLRFRCQRSKYRSSRAISP